MALKIVWTAQAKRGLNRVFEYLENEWSAKEILTLEEKINSFVERIGKYPKIHPSSGEFHHIRKGQVDKNNYMVYRIRPKQKTIEIINFRGTKQKP